MQFYAVHWLSKHLFTKFILTSRQIKNILEIKFWQLSYLVRKHKNHVKISKIWERSATTIFLSACFVFGEHTRPRVPTPGHMYIIRGASKQTVPPITADLWNWCSARGETRPIHILKHTNTPNFSPAHTTPPYFQLCAPTKGWPSPLFSGARKLYWFFF